MTMICICGWSNGPPGQHMQHALYGWWPWSICQQPQGRLHCLRHLCISFCQYQACQSCCLGDPLTLLWRHYCCLAIRLYPWLAKVPGLNVTIHVCSSFTILAPVQSNLTYFTRFLPSPSVSVYGALCALMSLTETAYAPLIFAYLGKGSLHLVLALWILELDNNPSDNPGQDTSA